MGTFGPGAQRFLAELATHNDRAWFEQNKDRFEADVRSPAIDFIEDAAGWLEMAGYPYRGEAKKVGGALSKIHRDVRFSTDKTPFHRHITIHFKHAQQSSTNVLPMVGLRIEPASVGMGGGIWAGQTATLKCIRDAIVEDPHAWAAATRGVELWGDSLKTAPRGYDATHPMIADLRRKAFLASVPIPAAALTGDLLAAFQHGMQVLQPFLEFLEGALLESA